MLFGARIRPGYVFSFFRFGGSENAGYASFFAVSDLRFGTVESGARTERFAVLPERYVFFVVLL